MASIAISAVASSAAINSRVGSVIAARLRSASSKHAERDTSLGKCKRSEAGPPPMVYYLRMHADSCPGRGAAHDHEHPDGVRGLIHQIFSFHSHDGADSMDEALASSMAGMRAVKVSLIGLGVTAVLPVAIVVAPGSVALAADTIHNSSDALTAIPLWIAFVLGRRAGTRRYNYGFGRVEDLAGMFVVGVIGLFAI